MTYIAAGGFVFNEWTQGGHDRDAICTVPEAAAAFVHMMKGPAICKDRGHDYSIRVGNTKNMWTCFRCGEPGWEVPNV